MKYNANDSPEPTEKSTGLDLNVLSVLPRGCQVLSVESHGTSFFARTRRINVKLADGSPSRFFIKALSGKAAKEMVHGEFESMKAIHATSPDFVPRPIAWGTYCSAPDTHFFLAEYREMMHEMPDPRDFSAQLATLHQRSISPNGKFGFHVPTYSGNLAQATDWEESWEVFFSKSLKKALELEIQAKGDDPELDVLGPTIFDKVIPRLLRPLESDGRSIKPSLVHGDLWYANSGIDVQTGKPVVFDACCFYAHNEYEFGQWRPTCNRFGNEYLSAYHEYVPKSPPEEDYDGRLDLYKLRFNTHVSALFPDSLALREKVLGDMKDLVERYGQ